MSFNGKPPLINSHSRLKITSRAPFQDRTHVKWFLVCLLLVGLARPYVEAVDEVKIGVLIRHRGLEEPLNKTLETLNTQRSVLHATRLVALVELIESDNSYNTSAAICRLLAQGVWAIVGPQSIQLTPIIQSMTSYYHVPLVLISWQPYSYYVQNTTSNRQKRNTNRLGIDEEDSSGTANTFGQGAIPSVLNYTINLYPMADQLSQAYYDLVRYKGWKSFSLIYDTSEDFLMVKNTLEMSFSDTSISIQHVNLPSEIAEPVTRPPPTSDYNQAESGAHIVLDSLGKMIPGAFDADVEDNEVRHIEYCNFESDNINVAYRKLMKDLRKRGVENVVLSMPLDKVCKVLKEAAHVGLLTVYNDFIVANLDAHLLNLTQLQHMSNVSGFSILDPGGQTDFTASKKWLGKRPAEVPKRLLSVEYTLMSDAITLLAYSLDELINESDFSRSITGPIIDCGSNRIWPYGDALMSILKGSTRHGGYTGDIRFDQFGQRVGFNLDFILYQNNNFKRVGTWNDVNRLSDLAKQSDDFGFQAIKNKTLRVTVANTSPYVMLKENANDETGNNRYHGYCVDLLNKLAKELQFKFVIKEVSDGQYGKIINGTWNGMVRELLDWQADLAIVDLTINKERQSAVDFTHPFMTLGIAIMYKKPKIEEAEMYSFLMPFSKEVWLSMWSAYVAMSLALWLVSRLSPIEWHNPHPCFETDERNFENEIHSIGASLWFTIGSLMQQGSDLAPRSPSVRTLASVWYFFTLILISSYTANFAAFLTASRMQSPIESAEDLSKQTKIDYGCKEGGSTQAFFASSNQSTYRRMWNFMESRTHQGVFPKDNKEGIKKVKKGNFAFLMESTSIEYMVQRDCELTQIGGLLDHKGYGIALRKRSPFRAALSKTIVHLNEKGELQDLKNKWWNSPGQTCEEVKESALATSELGIDKVGGVFVMLSIGVAIAFAAALLEFVWKSLKVSRDERDSIKVLLWREVLRILRCGPSKRPANENPTYASNRSNSAHPSMINLNEFASAGSLNKGNYAITKALNTPGNGALAQITAAPSVLIPPGLIVSDLSPTNIYGESGMGGDSNNDVGSHYLQTDLSSAL